MYGSTEMSRNKRPALNAATVAYNVGMNYPCITLPRRKSATKRTHVDHYCAAIKALFTSGDQVLLTSAVIDRTYKNKKKNAKTTRERVESFLPSPSKNAACWLAGISKSPLVSRGLHWIYPRGRRKERTKFPIDPRDNF